MHHCAGWGDPAEFDRLDRVGVLAASQDAHVSTKSTPAGSGSGIAAPTRPGAAVERRP
jgi:hypothetical protein